MITVAFPYGKEFLTHSFEDFQLKAVLTSKIHEDVYKRQPMGLLLAFYINIPAGSV